VAASGYATIYDVTERDRIYTALPLYHSAGGTGEVPTARGCVRRRRALMSLPPRRRYMLGPQA